MNIFKRIDQIIGNTPLLQVDPASESQAEVVLKLEYQNPGGSVKDRLALSVIEAAELDGSLQPGQRIVEATSGNTGIGLAMIAAAKGYPLTLTMPDSMSKERRRLLQAYGAQLVLTPAARGMKGAIEEAESISKEVKGFVPRQFDNAANVQIHYKTTGPEIWRDTDGEITHFVSSMGTTGTIMGTSTYLKEQNPMVQIVGVQPTDDSKIPGIRKWPKEYLPKIFNPDKVDTVMEVSEMDATEMAKRLAKEEGIFSGMSSGGAATVALRLAATLESGTIVSIVCDRGDRYLSSDLFE